MMLVFMAFIVTVLSSYKGDSSSGHPTHDPGISWWRLDFSDSCIGWTFSVKMSRYWCCLTTSILQRTIIVLNVKHCSFPVPAVWTNFGIWHFDKNRRHTHTHTREQTQDLFQFPSHPSELPWWEKNFCSLDWAYFWPLNVIIIIYLFLLMLKTG